MSLWAEGKWFTRYNWGSDLEGFLNNEIYRHHGLDWYPLALQLFTDTRHFQLPMKRPGSMITGWPKLVYPDVDSFKDRVHEDYAPSNAMPSCRFVGSLGSGGELYDLKTELSTGDAQLDADCIQALMGASASCRMSLPSGKRYLISTFPSILRPHLVIVPEVASQTTLSLIQRKLANM